jgi:hypothetical protein
MAAMKTVFYQTLIVSTSHVVLAAMSDSAKDICGHVAMVNVFLLLTVSAMTGYQCQMTTVKADVN